MLSLQVSKDKNDVVFGMFRNETNVVKHLKFSKVQCARYEIDDKVESAIGYKIDYVAKMFDWKYGHHIAMSMYSLYVNGYSDPSYYNSNLIYVKLSEESKDEVYEENFLLDKLNFSGVKLCTQSLSVPEIQYGLVMVSLNYICMLIKINDVWGWVDDSFFNVISNDNEEMEQMCNDFLALVKQ